MSLRSTVSNVLDLFQEKPSRRLPGAVCAPLESHERLVRVLDLVEVERFVAAKPHSRRSSGGSARNREDEVRDMFPRLRNGTTLKAPEKRNAMTRTMRDFVKDVAGHPFFGNCRFSNSRFAFDGVVRSCLVPAGVTSWPIPDKSPSKAALHSTTLNTSPLLRFLTWETWPPSQ